MAIDTLDACLPGIELWKTTYPDPTMGLNLGVRPGGNHSPMFFSKHPLSSGGVGPLRVWAPTENWGGSPEACVIPIVPTYDYRAGPLFIWTAAGPGGIPTKAIAAFTYPLSFPPPATFTVTISARADSVWKDLCGETVDRITGWTWQNRLPVPPQDQMPIAASQVVGLSAGVPAGPYLLRYGNEIYWREWTRPYANDPNAYAGMDIYRTTLLLSVGWDDWKNPSSFFYRLHIAARIWYWTDQYHDTADFMLNTSFTRSCGDFDPRGEYAYHDNLTGNLNNSNQILVSVS